MPRGYRCFIFAALGCLTLAAGAHPQPSGKAEHTQRSDAVADALGHIATTYDKQARDAERSPEQRPCKPDQEDRESNLCATWKASDAAETAAWWARLSGLLGIAGLIGVGGALVLTIKSNRIAEDTAKRQLRAYVTINNVVIVPDHIDPGKIRATVDFTNSGETPATNLVAEMYMGFRWGVRPVDYYPEPPIEEEGSVTVIGKGAGTNISHTTLCYGIQPNDVLAGDYTVLAYGRIRYLDIFKDPRETRFRFYSNLPLRNRGLNCVAAKEGNEIT